MPFQSTALPLTTPDAQACVDLFDNKNRGCNAEPIAITVGVADDIQNLIGRMRRVSRPFSPFGAGDRAGFQGSNNYRAPVPSIRVAFLS